MRGKKFHTTTLMDIYLMVKELFLVIPFLVIMGLIAFVPKAADAIAENKVINDIDKGNYDYFFRDVSKFSTQENSDSQASEYEGKIVTFTGVISEITMYSVEGESSIFIDSAIIDETCACCEFDDVSASELNVVLSEGEKVRIIGEVYRSDEIIYLRHCKIATVNYN